jgi:hypothetical protein
MYVGWSEGLGCKWVGARVQVGAKVALLRCILVPRW